MTQTTLATPAKAIVQDEIVALMQELPDDSLLMLREFGRLLLQYRPTAVPASAIGVPLPAAAQAHFPLVRVAPVQLLNLIGALPPLGGDALADSEALYERD
jgi:hypothetical protein